MRGGDDGTLTDTRAAAQKIKADPKAIFPMVTCVILFLITLVIFLGSGEDVSFGIYIICLSLMAMNIAASLSFILFQDTPLNDTYLQIFLGITALSCAFWLYFTYSAYNKREGFKNDEDDEDD